jgi:mRNA degradation ribonuclease J1/J2
VQPPGRLAFSGVGSRAKGRRRMSSEDDLAITDELITVDDHTLHGVDITSIQPQEYQTNGKLIPV